MKKKNIALLVLAGMLNIYGLFSQETFNVMFYNLLNYPLENNVENRLQYLNTVVDDYRPDLFMVCELNNENGANDILAMMQSINPNYNRAAFVLNNSDDNLGNQNDLQNLIYFDTSKFILESQNEVITIYRDFNHYRLKLNTVNQSTNPVYIDVIVCHLKASSGTDNQALRFQMVQDLTAYLATFPANSNVIIGGDLNIYTHSEPAFQELIDTSNNITFVDPANRIGSWHNNSSYIDVFTQSTRTQTGLGGTTGGFDDRFDFILASENMLANTDIFYVNDSYKVFGNNANTSCHNQEINSANCSGTDFDFNIRNALYYFSDHLPVTLQLQTTEVLNTHSPELKQPIRFVGSNILNTSFLELEIHSEALFNTTITIYNGIGQLVKTIPLKNSIYIREDISNLSNGLYYITLSQFNSNPLKFVVAN